MWTLEVGAEQFIVACLGCIQHIAALARGNAGIVDQQIQLLVMRFEMCHQGIAILCRTDVALQHLSAGFSGQGLSSLMISAIGRNHAVSFRKLDCNCAADAPAGARNQRDWFILLRQFPLNCLYPPRTPSPMPGPSPKPGAS